ncbi:MAG TPA: RluA family pseudouridine synthase [Gammaproteobacteria bacterium]|nr:RluA family pseudouridine synthase [Gammaproteobacteria bacterium]
MENNHIFYKVGLDRQGQRVDNALMAFNRSIPKGLIYRSIRKGAVRVNDSKVKQEYRLQEGDILRYPIWSADSKDNEVVLNQALLTLIANSVLYQDDNVLVLNKPQGVVCQKGSKSPVCLQDYLSEIYPGVSWHLTHRLDKDTSGVLVLAKNVASARWVSGQFLKGAVKKRYWALVDGIWRKQGWHKVSFPILKKNNQAYAIISDQGKEAVSYFRVLKKSSESSLMEVRIDTGRTHQIRVHANHIGYPLLGDKKYYSSSPQSFYFLHARSLKIVLPQESSYSSFTAPLDKSVSSILKERGLLIEG